MKFILANLKYFLTLIIVYLAPVHSSMIVVGILIVIDTILGVSACKINKQKIESRKFARVLIKMLAYQLLIITAHLCETSLIDIPFTKITLTFIAISEFLSISESFSKITGQNFIGYIKSFLQKKLDNAVKVKQDKNEY